MRGRSCSNPHLLPKLFYLLNFCYRLTLYTSTQQTYTTGTSVLSSTRTQRKKTFPYNRRLWPSCHSNRNMAEEFLSKNKVMPYKAKAGPLILWFPIRAQKGTTRLALGHSGCVLQTRGALFIKANILIFTLVTAWHAFNSL